MADRIGPKHRVAKIYGDAAYHWLPHDAIYTLCNQNSIEQLYDPRFTPAAAMPKVACATCVEKRHFEMEFETTKAKPVRIIRHFLPKGSKETACGIPINPLRVETEDSRFMANCPACREKDDTAARKRNVDTPEKVLAIYDKAVQRYEKRLQDAVKRGMKK